MGFFSRKQENSLPWIKLQSIEEWNKIIEESNEKPILIFKHSTRCSISSMALNRFESEWKGNDEINIFYLDLLSYREISNAIEKQTGIIHQSPQVIVLKENRVVYSATHSSIDATQALNSIQ